MKAMQVIQRLLLIPGMPWGVDLFWGKHLCTSAEVDGKEFIDCTHHFDICKRYLVIWDNAVLRDFVADMPEPDILIKWQFGTTRCWEVRE